MGEEKMQARRRERLLWQLEQAFTLLAGSLLYAFGYLAFIAPHTLVLGGATGLATVFFTLWRMPVGLCVLLINLPLIIWSCFAGGLRATIRALIGVAATSFFLFLLSPLSFPPFSSFWGAVLGGAVSGAGIGILLSFDYTTGGSELAAALLLQRKRRHLTVGRLVLLFDTVIVLVATAVLATPRALPYSVALNVSFAIFLDLFMRMGMHLPHPQKIK